jgi:hypothetical protein
VWDLARRGLRWRGLSRARQEPPVRGLRRLGWNIAWKEMPMGDPFGEGHCCEITLGVEWSIRH